jgi:hypothetical protein
LVHFGLQKGVSAKDWTGQGAFNRPIARIWSILQFAMGPVNDPTICAEDCQRESLIPRAPILAIFIISGGLPRGMLL